jgi:hypothetical protein
MFRNLKRKRFAIPVGIVASLVIAGAAVAYFTTTGTGSGSASVGTAGTWTVAANANSPAVTLYPGQGIQPLSVKITNPSGNGAQNLAQINATIIAPTGGSNTPNPCTAADFALTSSSGWVIDSATTAHFVVGADFAAGDTHDYTGLNAKMLDSGLNQNGCQSAQVNIKYDAS